MLSPFRVFVIAFIFSAYTETSSEVVRRPTGINPPAGQNSPPKPRKDSRWRTLENIIFEYWHLDAIRF